MFRFNGYLIVWYVVQFFSQYQNDRLTHYGSATERNAQQSLIYIIDSLSRFKVASLSLMHLQHLHHTAIETSCQINNKMSTKVLQLKQKQSVDIRCYSTPCLVVWFLPYVLVNVHHLSLIRYPHISNWPSGGDYLYRKMNVFNHVSIIVIANGNANLLSC